MSILLAKSYKHYVANTYVYHMYVYHREDLTNIEKGPVTLKVQALLS